jgi:hypothetical protein
MINYLTHHFRKGATPFQSLSGLPDEEAISIMRRLCDDTPYGARFKDPHGYLTARRQTEQWVRRQFIAKGGRPAEDHPFYMILGSSPWAMKAVENSEDDLEIRIPITAFRESEVSFTYPDSMISLWFTNDRPAQFYMPEYHGKIFTISEILAIVEAKGLPEECWETGLTPDLAPYIEAQVWSRKPLLDYARYITDHFGNPAG